MTNITEIKAKLDELGAKMKEHDRRFNEGGHGFNPYRAEFDRLADEYTRLRLKNEDEAFAAEWTREVFDRRRAEWNTECAKLPLSAKGLAWKDIKDLEARLGYTMDDLKRAKALLGVE